MSGFDFFLSRNITFHYQYIPGSGEPVVKTGTETEDKNLPMISLSAANEKSSNTKTPMYRIGLEFPGDKAGKFFNLIKQGEQPDSSGNTVWFEFESDTDIQDYVVKNISKYIEIIDGIPKPEIVAIVDTTTTIEIKKEELPEETGISDYIPEDIDNLKTKEDLAESIKKDINEIKKSTTVLNMDKIINPNEIINDINITLKEKYDNIYEKISRIKGNNLSKNIGGGNDKEYILNSLLVELKEFNELYKTNKVEHNEYHEKKFYINRIEKIKELSTDLSNIEPKELLKQIENIDTSTVNNSTTQNQNITEDGQHQNAIINTEPINLKKEIQQVQENFEIVETTNNGNCFFDAVTKAYNNDNNYTIEKLRQKISNNSNDNLEYINSVLANNLPDNKTIHKNNEELDVNDVKITFGGSTPITTATKYFTDNGINHETIYSKDINEKIKTYLQSNSYWADEFAINKIEKQLKVKFIIFDGGEYTHKLDIKKIHKINCMIDKPSTTDNINFIILGFYTNHYVLLQLKAGNKRMFTYNELPDYVKTIYENTCNKTKS